MFLYLRDSLYSGKNTAAESETPGIYQLNPRHLTSLKLGLSIGNTHVIADGES